MVRWDLQGDVRGWWERLILARYGKLGLSAGYPRNRAPDNIVAVSGGSYSGEYVAFSPPATKIRSVR